jgi:prepilin-type N-terminal cleavage/methylation domain-containing protein/prepilin-type processing-associated H-X9-DG protein
MNHRKRAFTLIELLVVIAIIAILAAILFPVFAQAKAAAKKASDLSNIKQLCTAELIYCADYDDKFPGNALVKPEGGNSNIYYGYGRALGWEDPIYDNVPMWTKSLFPYTKNKQIFHSPVDNANGGDAFWNGSSTMPKTNYFMNGTLMWASQTDVPQVAELVMFRSHKTSHRLPFANPHWYVFDTSNGGGCWAEWVIYDKNDGTDKTFSDGANYGWADGHAKYRKFGTLKWSEFGEIGTNRSDLVIPDGYNCMTVNWRGAYPGY